MCYCNATLQNYVENVIVNIERGRDLLKNDGRVIYKSVREQQKAPARRPNTALCV